MSDQNIVRIHGKEYITVAGRLQIAHESLKKFNIITEVIPNPSQVIIRATVTTDKGTFTGISAANPNKLIEKQNPYEVAETSAVGRALGFAGYGVDGSIATADEMAKASNQNQNADPLCTCGTKGKYHAKDCPANPANLQKNNIDV